MASSSLVRRFESGKCELPPSMTMSPFSRNGSSCSMKLSTAEPALTRRMILRGRLSFLQNSSIEWAPTIDLPARQYVSLRPP